MRHSRQEAIRIRGEVYPCELRLQVQDRTNERRVLVGKAIVFLPCPCRRFNVVERAAGLAPRSLGGHFREFGVLDHHSMNDAEESLVAGKEASSSSECVPLEHALASMFGKNLDDATSLRARGYIPLEVAASYLEHGVEFVGNELIRGENSKSGWVPAISRQ
jgi:hypothetical protein